MLPKFYNTQVAPKKIDGIFFYPTKVEGQLANIDVRGSPLQEVIRKKIVFFVIDEFNSNSKLKVTHCDSKVC
jgi:hypothetical protein